MSGWKHAGKPTVAPVEGFGDPRRDPRYVELLTNLSGVHSKLLKMKLSENPALIGDMLGELRLGANQLFSYLNIYIDALSDLQQAYARKRQTIFEERMLLPKSSPSGAEHYAREITRVDDSEIKIVENRIQQIKNEFIRYDGICMYLQSRMNEFNTERMVG
jgi:hypothetical protein